MKKIYLIIIFILCLFLFNINVKAIEDGIYTIHSAVNYDYVIDANNAVAKNGTNVQLYINNGGNSQKWYIKNTSDGYVQIKSILNEEYVLDIKDGVINNSSNIQLWDNQNSFNQKWRIKKDSKGYYVFTTIDDLYNLDVNGAVAKNYSNIQLWDKNESLAQKYILEKHADLSKTIEDGIYTISSGLKDSMVLDIYGGNISVGTNIQLYQQHLGYSQQFLINYMGEGYYNIKVASNPEYALEYNNSNRTNIELNLYTNSDSQKWIISKSTSGTYNIISRSDIKKAMDVSMGTTTNSTNIGLYNYHNKDNQKFKFSKYNQTGSKDLENGYYFINLYKDSNKTLDINGGVMSDNRNVEAYSLNYGLNQKWYVEYMSDGYYKILSNKNDQYSLQVVGNNVNIGIYKDLDNQKWIIKKNGTSYNIISKTGKNIDLYGGYTKNGTNIQIYTDNKSDGQRFKFKKTTNGISSKILSDGIYIISSSLDNQMVLDVLGAKNENGTKIGLWSTNGKKNQKFKIEYLSNGYYKIITLVDISKVLDVSGASTASGASVLIYNNNNNINQQWIIKDAGDGYYNIISNCGGNYLSVENNNATEGAKISLLEGNDSNSQKFKFIKTTENSKVIDVSSHQGKIDWNKVYNAGIYGVILRIGTWETLDSRFYEYLSEVERLEIPYGIYLFSYASTVNGANIEANFTKNVVNGTLSGHEGIRLNPTLGIYYDIEDWYFSDDNTSNILKKNDYDNIISTYINNVSSGIDSRYKVKVYANSNYALNKFNDYARSQIDWLADYRGYKGYTGPVSLWQYTSSATLDGINGYVDMSYLQ